MAQITITTSTRQDQAVTRMTDAFNAVNPSAQGLTPLQFAQQSIRELLDRWVNKTETDSTVTKVAAYQMATDADKAAIDSILSKYQV